MPLKLCFFCSVPSWPFLLKSRYPFTTSLFLTLTYISLPFSPSLLLFHYSQPTSIFYPLSLSALTLFPVLPAIFCPTIFPLGWTYGYQVWVVCGHVSVWKSEREKEKKGRRRERGRNRIPEGYEDIEGHSRDQDWRTALLMRKIG